VKQSVLYCISIVVQAIPLDFLSGDSTARLVEQVRSFLAGNFLVFSVFATQFLFFSDVSQTDPHSKSADMAVQVEAMLNYSLQQALAPKIDSFGNNSNFLTSLSDGRKQRGLTLQTIRDLSLSTTNLSLSLQSRPLWLSARKLRKFLQNGGKTKRQKRGKKTEKKFLIHHDVKQILVIAEKPRDLDPHVSYLQSQGTRAE
jgi:hypothetical protein